jgi:hypothetical protein
MGFTSGASERVTNMSFEDLAILKHSNSSPEESSRNVKAVQVMAF